MNLDYQQNLSIEQLLNIVEAKDKTINLLNEQNYSYYNQVLSLKDDLFLLENKTNRFIEYKNRKINEIKNKNSLIRPRSSIILRIAYFVFGFFASWSFL